MNDTLIGRFRDKAATLSGKTVIISKKDDGWADISYTGLKDSVDSLSSLLSKEAIGKNDKVAIILKNRPEWPEIFFAAVSVGAIVIPIYPGAEGREVTRILNDSGVRLVFLGNESACLERDIAEHCGAVKKIISIDSPAFSNDLKGSAPYRVNVDIGPEDIACILYTSGTTDEPKGVMLSHKNLLSNVDSIKKLHVLTEDDRILSILPLHHIYPLTVTMIVPLVFGITVIYPGTMRGEELLDAMKETHPTVLAAVPQLLYIFHQKIMIALKKIPILFRLPLLGLASVLYKVNVRTGINLSRRLFRKIHRRFGPSMRLFISGGAKLDEHVEQDLLRFGFTIIEGYGLTETSPILTLNPPGRIKIGSAGLVIPDVKIKIGDKDEKGFGEVMASGPNIMKGYYKRDDLTARVMEDGWFRTGDLGYIDNDGYLFLSGRSKDVIVLSSGLKVYPDEVERAYGACRPVREICIFEAPARKGPEGNQVLWAVVVPNIEVFNKDGEGNLREVIKANFDNIQVSLPPHKRIMGFVITLEPLSRTLLGKLKRFIIKEEYLPKIMEESVSSSAGVKTISEEDKVLMGSGLAKKVLSYLKEYTRLERDVLPQDSLELDLAIDSLGRIELASGLEKILNIKIKDENIGGVFVVRDLIKNLERLMLQGERIAYTPSGSAPGEDGKSGRWAGILEEAPNEDNLKKLDLRPAMSSRLIYSFLTGGFFLLFKTLYQLKIEGSSRVPRKGPYIIFANHTSFFDGVLIGISLPRYASYDIFYLSFRKYFNVPVLRSLIKTCRIIPVDFFTHLSESLRSAYYVLKNGKNVCIFPEGRISIDGNIKDFKKGFGILMRESRVKLVPAIIEGAHEAWPRGRKFPRLYPIRVRFGEAIAYEELEKEASKIKGCDEYSALTIAARGFLQRLKVGP